MTGITKLQELKMRVQAIKPGESGALVRAQELRDMDVPEVPLFDIKGRAEWLRDQLSFPCDIKESATTDAWVFTPKNSN
jgi:hypothetical protein